MYIARLFGVLMLFAMCCLAQPVRKAPAKTNCEPFLYERLRRYFEINETRPAQIINNLDDPPLPSQTRKLSIGDQTVEWIDETVGIKSNITIRINGDAIPLSGGSTVNAPNDDLKFSLGYVNGWDQIRLYELYNQKLIAISMHPNPCTGLSCSVGVQLWYDVKTKQKTLFGTFRTDPNARLFGFSNAEGVEEFYVMGTNYRGELRGEVGPLVVKYELYKLRSDGQFQIQKNSSGANYFIKHTSYPDSELVKGVWKRKKNLPSDTIEQNWIEKVLIEDQ